MESSSVKLMNANCIWGGELDLLRMGSPLNPTVMVGRMTVIKFAAFISIYLDSGQGKDKTLRTMSVDLLTSGWRQGMSWMCAGYQGQLTAFAGDSKAVC